MFKKHSLFSTLIIQSICGIVLMYVAFASAKYTVWASPLQVVPATPQPFLGPVYYGSEYVYNVFDHNLPCASVCADDNNDLLHYNGTTYLGVTGTPDPAASPTPTHWPTVTPYIPDAGYGYDEHAGIDYGLKYEPVLAAADGKVTVADWHHHSDHHRGFGLYVQLLHEEHSSYSTLYAHLSVVTVQLNEIVTADPLNRTGVVGISGNTGAVFGCGTKDVEEDPLCGAHLHFETRKGTGYHPMNPYGYTSTTVPDPWPTNTTYGVFSYPLWATPPAIAGTPQYPVGPTVSAPPAPVAARTIDDADPEFDFYPIEPIPCMEYRTTGGLYGSFRYAEANTPTYCEAWWHITPNELTQPGWYDVYVHIPEITWTTQISLTRGAEYRIISELRPPQTAIVVQAAYPNNSHPDRWVYIGRYEFAMEGANEYIRVSNQTFTSSGSDDGGGDGEGFIVAADAIQLAPVNPGQPITPTPSPTITPTPTLTGTPTPIGTPTPSIAVSVNIGSDDAGQNPLEYPDCSVVSLDENEIYLGRCPNGANIISGFRFTSVPIPQGAIITQAKILFVVDSEIGNVPDTHVIDMIFQGELSANSLTFSLANPPSARWPLTTSVPWYVGSNDPWKWPQTRYTPDLKAIVQEIVNLPDWDSGDPMTIVVRPRPGWVGSVQRRVIAFEREDTTVLSARLEVWYSLATPTPSPTATPMPSPTATPPILNTGFMSPNASVAGAGGDGNGYETQPHNAYNDGGSLAGDKKSGVGTIVGDPCVSSATDKHIFRDFNIAIPTNAAIRGIEVRLDALNSIPSALPQMCVQLSWDGGITWTNAPQVTPVLTNSELTYILGSPTYLWGRSWLPTEFANANFRVRVIDFANSTSTDFYLDWVAVKVTYQ